MAYKKRQDMYPFLLLLIVHYTLLYRISNFTILKIWIHHNQVKLEEPEIYIMY